jgi:transcriptional regulator with XRE-family HTH domain
MQEVDSDLRTLMKAKGLNQTRLARLARVSQASVSRALKGDARQRRGGAYIRLFNYIQKQARHEALGDLDKERVHEAIDRIWDVSKAHAAAVAKVIQALDEFRSSQIKEE